MFYVTVLVVLFVALITRLHMKEQKKYREKLAIYQANGGKPYESPRQTKLSKEAWAHQDEINRIARQIAGLGEFWT